MSELYLPISSITVLDHHLLSKAFKPEEQQVPSKSKLSCDFVASHVSVFLLLVPSLDLQEKRSYLSLFIASLLGLPLIDISLSSQTPNPHRHIRKN